MYLSFKENYKKVQSTHVWMFQNASWLNYQEQKAT